MAKKFVRGITEIRTINNQDFNTNNINDLLADGNDNYIHRRKADKSEEYHCLTDNIKTIKSSNEYLTVTNDNANNTATLTVNPPAEQEYTGANGITITNHQVSFKHVDGFKGDLNTLKDTQFVKTTTGVSNLPPNETIPDGILEVIRIGDILKQTYTPFYTGRMYIRTANDLGKLTERWRNWFKVDTSDITVVAAIEPDEEDKDAISTVPELGEE